MTDNEKCLLKLIEIDLDQAKKHLEQFESSPKTCYVGETQRYEHHFGLIATRVAYLKRMIMKLTDIDEYNKMMDIDNELMRVQNFPSHYETFADVENDLWDYYNKKINQEDQ